MTASLLIALLLLVYTYAGYPLVLRVLAYFAAPRQSPARDSHQALPMVSVLMCVHNGAAFLPRKIESLLAQDYPPARLEILIYSDGSTDDTVELARTLAAAPEANGR